MLQIENVTKSFGGLVALRGVTLSLSEGQIKSIIGPNGAGKTTLFNLISGFMAPEDGQIRFYDRTVTGQAPERIAHAGMARTFQVVKPFNNLTVIENVLVGSLNAHPHVRKARQKAGEILEYIGMADKAEWPARKLTLEDLKRLELGRALATRPRLLLLDEVMAGLNPAEVDEFIELIRRIRNDGITILMIEHIMHAILSLSDEVFVLNYGIKIYEGDAQGAVKDQKV
ncbi:MAG: ABC transporter ATP-binding protein, partial [Syntrophales bacterium LBB04]|nr:ABC transporter ATP-binding protein [Syntrophales bacterium LBB04]